MLLQGLKGCKSFHNRHGLDRDGRFLRFTGKIALQRFGYSLGKKLLRRKLDFQLCSRNRHFSPTVQPIEAGECGKPIEPETETFCLLPARLLMLAIPLLLRRMACGVQGQGWLRPNCLAAQKSVAHSLQEPSHGEANYTNTVDVFFALGYLRGVVPERTSFR